jgi:hypothetical protein
MSYLPGKLGTIGKTIKVMESPVDSMKGMLSKDSRKRLNDTQAEVPL